MDMFGPLIMWCSLLTYVTTTSIKQRATLKIHAGFPLAVDSVPQSLRRVNIGMLSYVHYKCV